MNIHESAEDYLEAILMINERSGRVRSIDVVEELGYSKPSISIAMKHLRENGYITMDNDGYITLTGSGFEIAQRIYTRHRLLTRFLTGLGVSAEAAAADACKIEHDLSEEAFDKLTRYAASSVTPEENMYRRRSVRAFTAEAVSAADAESLLRCAMAAPSACNRRPWEFYVVRSAEKLEALRAATRYTDYNAPLIVVVAGNTARSAGGETGFWVQDCSAAAENLLLEADALGLGACWCGIYPGVTAVKRVRRVLSLPEEIVPLALIHVGHPAESPEPRTQYEPDKVHTPD